MKDHNFIFWLVPEGQVETFLSSTLRDRYKNKIVIENIISNENYN